MKTFRNKMAGFTLVEIMIVVLIIGILLAIAIPNFVQAREAGRAKACVGNLKQIDSATQQYCMDKKLNSTNYAASTPTLDTNSSTGLIGTSSYMRTTPACPSGGTYAVPSSITAPPSCSISGTIANKTGTGDYIPPTATGAGNQGKYYHGIDL